jgi:hypothetical protein
MTTHGENLGSRKVEPETNGLPKWRLRANFLLRELARMWYGEKSIFDPGSVYTWRDFVFLFIELIYAFGEEHGVSEKEASKRLFEAYQRWLTWHGGRPTFSSPCYEAKWYAIQMLGEELAEKLFDYFDVGVILSFVEYAYTFARRGAMPPYKPFARLEAYEDFEALPVDPWWEERYYNNKPLPF